jgi:hypothetical protein
VQNIVGWVELPHRLGCCSLVSKAWRRAAVAATSDIRLQGYVPQHKLSALSLYLQKHGKHVQQVSMSEDRSSNGVLKLPLRALPRLQQLTIAGCQLQEQPLDSSAASSAVGHSQQAHSGTSCFGQHGNCGAVGASSMQLPVASLSSLTALDLSSATYALTGGLAGLSVLTWLRKLKLSDVDCQQQWRRQQ